MGRITAALLASIVLLACGGDDGDAGPAATGAVGTDGSDSTNDTETSIDSTDSSAPETTASSTGEAVDDDACAIATQADAELILGEPVALQEPTSTPGVVAECVWVNVAEDHGAVLQYRVFDGAQFFTAEVYASEEGYEELDGLGDDAFVVLTDNTATLYVLDGDRVLQLDASKGGGEFDPAAAKDQLVELARRGLN